MQQEQIKLILAQLIDHEARLKVLEGGTQLPTLSRTMSVSGKQKTLRELVKGKKFKSGQEQVASIVGYYEKVVGQRIQKGQIKVEWDNAKMNGRFSPMFFSRAKDELIRLHPDGTCDLTQTGEELLERLLNNESADATSK